jgi:hypothetical protein
MTNIFQGPLKISANQRYFVDANGEPFFWMGDTAWPLFAQYTTRQAETYIQRRAEQGFTVIQGVLAWGGGTGFETRAPGPNAAGHVPWLEGDPTHPNEAYFRNVDHLVEFAAKHGVVLAMLPTWGYYASEANVFTPETASSYGRWLGARYKNAPNVVWVNGGDRTPRKREAVYRAIGLGLREGDGGAHLITYHPCGWEHSSYYFHTEDWLDFNMIETWTEWSKVYPAVLADTYMQPAKPVVLGEGAYEDGPEYPLGPITPLIVRRQAWWAFMAGGFITYGQNSMWRMDEGWLSRQNTPGAGHMTLFRKIASSRSWWKMMPDQGLFASGTGCDQTLNTAVRTLDWQCAMLYLSSRCHIRVCLDRIKAIRVKATWVNPASGEEQDGGIFKTGFDPEKLFNAGTSQCFSTPAFWEDAVLILDAVRE